MNRDERIAHFVETGVKQRIGELTTAAVWFLGHMIKALVRNSHKQGWQTDTPEALIKRLREEVDELENAVLGGKRSKVIHEAADVGNFAMFIAYQHRQEKR
jgi:phosphoribosyl-ATP pyrophosphohydrolase